MPTTAASLARPGPGQDSPGTCPAGRLPLHDKTPLAVYNVADDSLRNGRLEAQCFDGTRRLGNIRGKLRKKVWINQGDIILLSLRDYQDDKGDVMYVAAAPPPPRPHVPHPFRNTPS